MAGTASLLAGSGKPAEQRSFGLPQVLGAGHPLEAFFLDAQVKAVRSKLCVFCCMLCQSSH